MIVKRVQPIYPAQARQMHLEGTVELQANISQSGSIAGVKQLSGEPDFGTRSHRRGAAVEVQALLS